MARIPEGRLALGVAVIFALVFLVYRPILPGNFLMDDHRLVEADNPLTNGELHPRDLWFQTDFPLSTLAFWLEWRAWGNNPGGYHAVNIMLHGLSGALLWAVLARLKIPGAWLAGAIFAVHPVCVNSVSRIAELKNTLSLPFFLFSFWLYLRHEAADRRRAGLYYILSLLAFVLALLSKTSTIMLPVVLLGCAAFQRGRISRNDLLRASPFFVLSLAFGLMSAWFQKHQALVGSVLPPESFGERLALAGRFFWFYLGKAFFPVKLNLVYPQWKMDAASVVAYLPVVLFAAALILCWRFRRGWGRGALFGLGVFAVTLFPALGFFDSQFATKWQVSDHLQYLPLMAPIALVAGEMAFVLPAAVFRGVAVVLVVVLSVLSFERARVFGSEETLFRDTLAKNPAAWGTQSDLGVLLAARGDYGEAIEHFVASLDANPNNADAEANFAQTLLAQGKFYGAEPHFRAALALKPNDPETRKKYGRALLQQQRFAEALAHLQVALALKPDPPTRLECATLYQQTGDSRRAVIELRRVLAVQPDSVEALNNLAWILATSADDTLRDGTSAVQYAERAVRLPPLPQMCVSGTLAAAYAEAGRFSNAIATAEKAVQSETAAGQTRFAALNQQLLTFYRAGKAWHQPPVKSESP